MNSSINKYIDYFRDLIRGRERNAFERNLERDPFEKEALEGFQSISPEEIESDMKQLNRQLTHRVKRSNRMLIFRIAAGIAVILSLSISYLLIFDKQIDEFQGNYQVSETIEKAEKLTEKSGVIPAESLSIDKDVTVDNEIIEPKIIPDKSESALDNTPAIISKEKSVDLASVPLVETLDVEQDENTAGISMEFDDEAEILVEEAPEILTFYAYEEEEVSVISEPLSEVVETAFASQKSSSRSKKVAIPSSVSIEEVVVSNDEAYNILQSDSFFDSRISGAVETNLETIRELTDLEPEYIPASPEIGMRKYRKYIKESVRFPEDFPELEKAVVILKFILNKSGKAEHFRIIESQDSAFSKEAIRLVEEGPQWIPSTRSGVYSAEEIRLRIVFKH